MRTKKCLTQTHGYIKAMGEKKINAEFATESVFMALQIPVFFLSGRAGDGGSAVWSPWPLMSVPTCKHKSKRMIKRKDPSSRPWTGRLTRKVRTSRADNEEAVIGESTRRVRGAARPVDTLEMWDCHEAAISTAALDYCHCHPSCCTKLQLWQTLVKILFFAKWNSSLLEILFRKISIWSPGAQVYC